MISPLIPGSPLHKTVFCAESRIHWTESSQLSSSLGESKEMTTKRNGAGDIRECNDR